MILKKQIKIINKGWGREKILANVPAESTNEKGYCLKLLIFDGKSQGSMHFHSLKHETFYILEGNFKIQYIDHSNADQLEINLIEGDVLEIPPNHSHRIICLDKGTIIEASSPDRPEDSYRVAKGDSQKSP